MGEGKEDSLLVNGTIAGVHIQDFITNQSVYGRWMHGGRVKVMSDCWAVVVEQLAGFSHTHGLILGGDRYN